MQEFWMGYDEIARRYGPGYQGYSLFGRVHLGELAATVLGIVLVTGWYRRSTAPTRRRILWGVTLLLYPILLVAGGFRPAVRRLPGVLAFLFGSALPIYFLNKVWDTNFYFLNGPYSSPITALFTRWFGETWYILGFLPALALILEGMYLPWCVRRAHPGESRRRG